MLFKKHPQKFGFSISHTSRQPRSGEVTAGNNNKEAPYHFVSRAEFEALIAKRAFIEYTQYSNNYYGTSIAAVEQVGSTGKTCILDIEMEGVKNVKKSSLNARYVFIQPPSMGELESRLRGRGTDSEEDIAHRLAAARAELDYAQQDQAHDCIIVNDDKDRAYGKLEAFCLEEAM